MTWTKLAKGAFTAKHPKGSVNVTYFGGTLWAVSLNGRAKGSATNEQDAKQLAETLFFDA